MTNSRNSVHACPVCDSEGMLLGVLGNIVHQHCSNCGLNFHAEYDDTWKDLLSDPDE